MKTVVSNQYGLSVGYQFNKYYALRLGFNLERKAFTDSTIICGFAFCFPFKNQFSLRYLSLPLVNEFQFFNRHLILMAGFDSSFLLDDNSIAIKRDFGLIGGLGTQINVIPHIKWRLEAKLNRGLMSWHNKQADFSFDHFNTYHISTALIYSFEEKKK